MAGWDPRANELFLNALEIDSPTERQAYLETACGTDTPLRQAVEALLRAHAGAGGFLERPGDTAGLETDPAATTQEDRPGTVLAGRYKLLEQIGEGGMGTVWMAEQLEPIRRVVAVKLIKPGMDSAPVIARFEAERQALALMDHPNIARVLDAGTTAAGRPFFVMELVKGIPITRYCDDNQLTPRERLALMAAVCQAVQHAHQKGVIHRDLKPSNVLVAAYDGKPVPKVIDFGIAKAVGQRLTERTLVTGFGNVLGTLEYMSPEQAEFNALDVDTRSDVYSLGVLLYELLTGTTPLTRQRLEKAAILEVLRVIREEDPPRPSTRLSESKEGLGTISAQRRMEPARLTRMVRGELDWIVMKALEKDRRRRYETADALARDAERYLHDEAVEAGPPSTAYRVKKFVARHRTLVLGTALLVLTLSGGIVGTTWGLLRAEREKQAADAAREKALAAQADTQAFSDFLLFEVLASARLKSQVKQVPMHATIADAVTEAEKTIAERFKGKPTAEADVRHALGLTWRNLNKFDAAEKHFRRALELRRQHLGEDDPRTLSSLRCLGATLDEAGRTADAIPILEDALRRQRAVLSPDHQDTLLCMDNLAAAYTRADRRAEAVALQAEALEHSGKVEEPDSPEAFRRQGRLGINYARLNRPADAVPLLEKAVAGMKASAPTHNETLECMNALAQAFMALKDFDKAIPVFEELLALQKKIDKNPFPMGPKLQTMQMLAINYAEDGRIRELRALLKDYLAWQALPRSKGGDPLGAELLAEVGSVLLRRKQYASAEEFLRQCLKMREEANADEWRIASTRSDLGAALVGQKQYAAAEPLLLQGYEGLRQHADQLPPTVRHERRIEAAGRLVQLYDAWDQKDKANAWRKKLGEAKAARK
jgi:non-specific serine/threonine protein kinase/serine/threonine-protein kinase